MENSGGQDYRCFRDLSLDMCGHVFNVDSGAGVDHPGDVATDAGEEAIAVLISIYLANCRVRYSHHREEAHQDKDRPPQALMLPPAF